MAEADTWMAFYVGAYTSNTMHLNRAQHGSYLHLILAAFKNTGWLPNDDGLLAQIAKCTVREWKAERAVYAAFFDITDGRWTHARVTIEWEKAQRLTEQRRAAGTASAAKRQRSFNARSTDVATGSQQSGRPSEEQIPSVEPNGSTGGAPPGDPVKELFDAGVKLLTETGASEPNARSVIGKFRKAHGDEAVMGAIAEARRLQITEPIAWMTQRFAGAQKPRETWNQRRIREGLELLRQ